MPDGGEPRAVEVTESLADVDRAAWDACAGPENPFVSHDFLSALEESGSVAPDTGWLPQHLLLRDEAGALEGAAICYLKGHSMGEYVFDYGWANAYERAGGRYYPKLLSAIPFTPVTGPRLLTRAAADPEATAHMLAAGLVELTDRHGVSSLHVNFLPDDQAELLGEHGFLIRSGHQYHWRNDGYGSFEDFLGALSSRKRKAIRKERRQVADAGIRIETLTGETLKPEHWDVFYRFYVDTYDRKWGDPYLTRAFFDLLQERMADRVVLVMAYDGSRPIAGALNLKGTDALFGRNWGCVGEYKFLHFELCYYQAIDFAIAHGLGRVEAGTQGEHKIQRGYLPVETRSAHLLPNPSFRDAVARFLAEERRQEEQIRAMLQEHSPYRRE
jgi:hypothetical protein